MQYTQSEVAKRLDAVAAEGLFAIQPPRTGPLIAQDARQHNVLDAYSTAQFVQWLNDMDLVVFPEGTVLDDVAARFDSIELPVDSDAPKA